MKTMKILNLYSGIGGNRKGFQIAVEKLRLHLDVTAIEINHEIAKEYKRNFPQDTVIETDAKEFLLHNYENYDFIWASPPCQTHSLTNHFLHSKGVKRYPDMSLWQIIIFLQTFAEREKIKWCVENVKPYYEPLIKPSFILGRHFFWANISVPGENYESTAFKTTRVENENEVTGTGALRRLRADEIEQHLGMRLSEKIKGVDKRQVLRNCVRPEIAEKILTHAINSTTIDEFLKTGERI